MNYCVMCGRVQPPLTAIDTPSSVPSKSTRRYRRLTKEQQQNLMTDIQRGIAAGDLDMQQLSETYGVSRSTVAYWKKRLLHSSKFTYASS
jgi:transposase